MNTISGFKPLVKKGAKVLILGSMPGDKSLQMNQYYAHPRNSFWFILGKLCEFESDAEYAKRTQWLMEQRIALWDVLKHCSRSGSLDSAIKSASVIVNNFDLFLAENPSIRTVCFNGAKAQALYTKYVLPTLSVDYKNVELIRLPSTSPAFAAMRPQEKLLEWAVVKTKASQ